MFCVPPLTIDSNVEAGRVAVRSIAGPKGGVGPLTAELDIPADTHAPTFRQWFCFVARGALAGRRLALRLTTRECTWHDAFGDPYRVYATYDDAAWFRVPTRVEAGAIVVELTPERDRVKLAYHPPYPEARLAALLERARATSRLDVAEIGQTPQGRPIHLVSSGEAPASAPALWIIAQQHPGETMAGWFVEGLLDALLAPEAAALRSRARVHVVPRMNPDGCAVGNHRANAAGVDLNREWNKGADCAAEVAAVRAEMLRRDADFFLDVHGDERLPYVFLQRPDEWQGRPRHLRALEDRFVAEMVQAAPDFQTQRSYAYSRPRAPYLPVAANWVQHRFGCLSLTLEMPFSDNALAPRDEGWAPARSRALGSQTLAALAAALARGLLVS